MIRNPNKQVGLCDRARGLAVFDSTVWLPAANFMQVIQGPKELAVPCFWGVVKHGRDMAKAASDYAEKTLHAFGTAEPASWERGMQHMIEESEKTIRWISSQEGVGSGTYKKG